MAISGPGFGAAAGTVGQLLMQKTLQDREREERERARQEAMVPRMLQAYLGPGERAQPLESGAALPEGAREIPIGDQRFAAVPPPPEAVEPKLPPVLETSSGIFTRGDAGLEPVIDPVTKQPAMPFRTEPRGPDPYGGRTRDQYLADKEAEASIRAGGAAGGGVSPTTASVTDRQRALGAARAVSQALSGSQFSGEWERSLERIPTILQQWGYSSPEEHQEHMRSLGLVGAGAAAAGDSAAAPPPQRRLQGPGGAQTGRVEMPTELSPSEWETPANLSEPGITRDAPPAASLEVPGGAGVDTASVAAMLEQNMSEDEIVAALRAQGKIP